MTGVQTCALPISYILCIKRSLADNYQNFDAQLYLGNSILLKKTVDYRKLGFENIGTTTEIFQSMFKTLYRSYEPGNTFMAVLNNSKVKEAFVLNENPSEQLFSSTIAKHHVLNQKIVNQSIKLIDTITFDQGSPDYLRQYQSVFDETIVSINNENTLSAGSITVYAPGSDELKEYEQAIVKDISITIQDLRNRKNELG